MQGVEPSGEFRRIARFLELAGASAGRGGIVIGPGDDAAGVRCPAGEVLVVSTDASVEGVHFRREWLTWEAIGYRAAAAAMSDLAAMAARPVGALVSLALAPEHDRAVEEGLATGIGECLRSLDADLLGGDFCRSPGPVFIDVVAVGSCAAPVPRDGARPGDELWVTGVLGAAATATMAWESGLEPDGESRRAFERPRPRTAEAGWLATRVDIHAMIDLSDGLAGDAGQVAAASGAQLRMELEALPLPHGLGSWTDRSAALHVAAAGGEDYELLFAASPGEIEPLRADFRAAWGAELTRIGTVEMGEGVMWVDARGRPVEPPGRGFDHFPPDPAGSANGPS
ncbi:MAG: thiamine-phosphate kinase [Gemmatimonadota bacterium]